MLRKIVIAIALLIALSVGLLALGLAQAHWQINRINPPLPSVSVLDQLSEKDNGPVSVSYINSASQPSPDSDTVGHPSFVLEWSDGRIFLIDAGMDEAAALEFGRMGEALFSASPIQFHGAVSELLGDARERVQAIAFTHLHGDHTQGAISLCAAVQSKLTVYQTSLQALEGNYTTDPGRDDLKAAGCFSEQSLVEQSEDTQGPLPIPGFPGLMAIAAGGHTPGSTIYLASVGATIWVFAGDISNFKQSIVLNRPKHWLYSTFLTPESSSQLEQLRRWLGEVDARAGYSVVVSHDLTALQNSGIRAWGSHAVVPQSLATEYQQGRSPQIAAED